MHQYEIDIIRGRLYWHRNPSRGLCSMTRMWCGESFHLSRQKRLQSMLAGGGGAFILTSSYSKNTNIFFKELPRHGYLIFWQHLLSKTLIPNMKSRLSDVDGNSTTGGLEFVQQNYSSVIIFQVLLNDYCTLIPFFCSCRCTFCTVKNRTLTVSLTLNKLCTILFWNSWVFR